MSRFVNPSNSHSSPLFPHMIFFTLSSPSRPDCSKKAVIDSIFRSYVSFPSTDPWFLRFVTILPDAVPHLTAISNIISQKLLFVPRSLTADRGCSFQNSAFLTGKVLRWINVLSISFIFPPPKSLLLVGSTHQAWPDPSFFVNPRSRFLLSFIRARYVRFRLFFSNSVPHAPRFSAFPLGFDPPELLTLLTFSPFALSSFVDPLSF